MCVSPNRASEARGSVQFAHARGERASEGARPAIASCLQELNSLRPVTHDANNLPPHIDEGSKHYDYAILILVGFSNPAACAKIHMSIRTAEEWRSELCDIAMDWFGRRVSYEFASRYAIDEEWRHQVDAPVNTPEQRAEHA